LKIPGRKLPGIFDRKECSRFQVRSHSLPQAAGNALASRLKTGRRPLGAAIDRWPVDGIRKRQRPAVDPPAFFLFQEAWTFYPQFFRRPADNGSGDDLSTARFRVGPSVAA
jgi:hypothetical protein